MNIEEINQTIKAYESLTNRIISRLYFIAELYPENRVK